MSCTKLDYRGRTKMLKQRPTDGHNVHKSNYRNSFAVEPLKARCTLLPPLLFAFYPKYVETTHT